MSTKVPGILAGWRRWWFVRWTRSKVIEPSVSILKRGAEPHQLALSIAMGFTTGIFPLFGLAAALCALSALLLRSACNPPTMMLANFVATPAMLSLIVPFLRFGERVTGTPPMSLAPDALWKALTGRASHRLLLGLCHAVLGWAIAAPLILWALYRLSLPIVCHLTRKFTPLVSPRNSEIGHPAPPSPTRLKTLEAVGMDIDLAALNKRV